MSENEKNEIDDIIKEIRNKEVSQADENEGKQTEEASEKQEKTEPEDFDGDLDCDRDELDLAASEKKETQESFSLDSKESEIDLSEYTREYSDTGESEGSMHKKKKTGLIVSIVVIIIAVAAAVAFTLYNNFKKEPETTVPETTTVTTTAPVIYKNPLTNTPDYNKSAVDKRPVAIVVENASQARPQWGIDDEKYAPDIIVEGEVEGGESRMLWLYADYTKLPSQVGPIRSARPPFIKFSELFDSIFIHWGQSSSKGDYVGADTVFRQDNVDHINQMAYDNSVKLFARDKSRNVSTEHTGILYGDKVDDAVKKAGFRTDVNKNKFTVFSFYEKERAAGEQPCNTLSVKFSSRTYTRDWTYNSQDRMYHTSDYKTDVRRKNLLVLFDETQYVVKSNYKGSGRSETYCDYKLSGGTGKLAALGSVTDINWSVENGKLVIKDAQGKTVSLNTGNTWIGYASSNNGGTAVSASAQ